MSQIRTKNSRFAKTTNLTKICIRITFAQFKANLVLVQVMPKRGFMFIVISSRIIKIRMPRSWPFCAV